MRKKLLSYMILIMAILSCSSTRQETSAFQVYDPFTSYIITEEEKAVILIIRYTTYQLRYNEDAMIRSVGFKMNQIIKNYETEQNLSLQSLIISPFKQTIKRDNATGFTTITATSKVRYITE